MKKKRKADVSSTIRRVVRCSDCVNSARQAFGGLRCIRKADFTASNRTCDAAKRRASNRMISATPKERLIMRRGKQIRKST